MEEDTTKQQRLAPRQEIDEVLEEGDAEPEMRDTSFIPPSHFIPRDALHCTFGNALGEGSTSTVFTGSLSVAVKVLNDKW